MIVAQGKTRRELPWLKKHLTEIYHYYSQTSKKFNSGINWLGVMFGELGNLVLGENGED